ncbi:MAG: ABC transporter permease [Candidatus Diapherotrites archaeon]|nr:ABC transporter permease [Candidatus Diapherotrites archaeon]
MWNDVFTLAYREVLILTKIKIRILGLIFNALIWLVAMGFGLSPLLSISGVSYFAFLVPGMIGINLLFPSFFGASTLITDRQFGFLKEMLVAPIPRTTLVLGKALGLSFYATVSAAMVLAFSIILGFQINHWWTIPALIGIALLASLGLTCFGLALAIKIKDTQSFQLLGNFIVFPFFLLSGAFFPLDQAPWFIRYFSYINPITYAIDAMRQITLGIGHTPLILDLGVLFGFFIITLIVAAKLFDKSE